MLPPVLWYQPLYQPHIAAYPSSVMLKHTKEKNAVINTNAKYDKVFKKYITFE